MNLKNLMKEFLEEENRSSNHDLFGMRVLKESLDFPCEVSGFSSWEDMGDMSVKSFPFSCRNSMRSFCSYVMDLEQNQGILIALRFDSRENTVTIEVPHKLLGSNHFVNFFREIDNIHQDVSKSYTYEWLY